MTDLRTAAQQALEALEDKRNKVTSLMQVEDAITALRAALTEDALQKFTDVNQEIEAALAEPVQEPVAWMCSDLDLAEKGYSRFSSRCEGAWNIPVYTTPTQRSADPTTEDFSGVEKTTGNLVHIKLNVMRTALENIAGIRPIVNNLLSDKDIALIALERINTYEQRKN